MARFQVVTKRVKVLGEDLQVGDRLVFNGYWEPRYHVITKKVNNTLTIEPKTTHREMVTDKRKGLFGITWHTERYAEVDDPTFEIQPDKIYEVEVRIKQNMPR